MLIDLSEYYIIKVSLYKWYFNKRKQNIIMSEFEEFSLDFFIPATLFYQNLNCYVNLIKQWKEHDIICTTINERKRNNINWINIIWNKFNNNITSIKL